MRTVVAEFRAAFGSAPHVHWAPGRVNLIGDHIDYCGGRVLPMPIQYGTTVALAARRDRRVRARSLDQTDGVAFELDALPDLARGHWGRFVVGASAIACELGACGVGFDVVVSGDIPGSGLSSSASLSVGLLHAISSHCGRPFGVTALDGLALARAARRIEHEHVGVACGLMDQAVIAMGEHACAYFFDCADEAGSAVAIGSDSPAVVVIDSGKRRTLVDSAYNARLAETRVAAEAMGVALERLASAGSAALERVSEPIGRRRAQHVVDEQRRVDAAVDALRDRDWRSFGRLLDESHLSLRDLFEVSSPELDALVDACKRESTCFGARMTGAGFGGCVVALFARDGLDAAVARSAARYSYASG